MKYKELKVNELLELVDSKEFIVTGYLIKDPIYMVSNIDEEAEIINCPVIIHQESISGIKSHKVEVYYVVDEDIIKNKISQMRIYHEFDISKLTQTYTFYMNKKAAQRHIRALNDISKLGYKVSKKKKRQEK